MRSAANLLAARFYIAFDHQPFDQRCDARIIPAAVKNFTGDPRLLVILLIRIGMVRIYDGCRVLQRGLRILIQQQLQILKMVIGDSVPVLVGGTAQDRVGQRISGGMRLRASVDI